jgi:hypothetical protein
MNLRKLLFVSSIIFFSLVVVTAAQYSAKIESNKIFTMYIDDGFETGGEFFRLISINQYENYFLFHHELGDNLHIIPLEIPLDIGFVFALEGELYKIHDFSDSFLVLKHLYKFE